MIGQPSSLRLLGRYTLWVYPIAMEKLRERPEFFQHSAHCYINKIDEAVEGSGMGLFLIGDHLLKILPQNSKGAS